MSFSDMFYAGARLEPFSRSLIDGKTDRTNETGVEVVMDPDTYHPSIETSETGQHFIKEDGGY